MTDETILNILIKYEAEMRSLSVEQVRELIAQGKIAINIAR